MLLSAAILPSVNSPYVEGEGILLLDCTVFTSAQSSATEPPTTSLLRVVLNAQQLPPTSGWDTDVHACV